LASCNANDLRLLARLASALAGQTSQTITIHRTFQEPSLMTQTLSQLENRDAFIERHIGPDAQQQQEMLKPLARIRLTP
jgi:hypothetical protein